MLNIDAMQLKSILFLICILLLVSCTKDPVLMLVEPDFRNYAYYKTNQERVYTVDSIVYNDFTNTIDTFSFELKETIVDTLSNDMNGITYLSYRTKRLNDTSEWLPHSTLLYTLNTKGLERVADNKRVKVLAFPVNESTKWNGLVYQNSEPQLFAYSSINTSEILLGANYDSVASVLQVQEQNFIQDILIQEKYATNIGLIYLEDKNIETQNQKQRGLWYTMRLKNYRF